MTRPSELLFVTFLSRHGVRSPTQGEIDYLTPFASLPLPKWEVEPGRLSPHGQRIVRNLGDWYRQHYGPSLARDREVLPEELIHVRADKIHRDVLTAETWLQGLTGDDEPAVDVSHIPFDDPQPYDPVFLGFDSGMNAVEGIEDLVLGRIGGDIQAVIHSFRSPIMAMQDALGSAICQPELYGARDGVRADGTFEGTLEITQLLSDILILERANGWSFDRVGWGRIGDESLHAIAAVRTFTDRVLGRAPAYCRAQSSNMAAHLLAGMEQAVTGEAVPGHDVPPETRIAACFGHDTGVQSLGGLLNLEWQSRSFVPNQTPPAGAIVFELHRDTGTGDHFVRLFFVVPTMEQMVNAVPLSPHHPPSQSPIGLPRGHGRGTSLDVPWADFRSTVLGAIDRSCVSDHLMEFCADA